MHKYHNIQKYCQVISFLLLYEYFYKPSSFIMHYCFLKKIVHIFKGQLKLK